MRAHDLFDVLRINIFATDDEQVFFPADDIELIVEQETEIAAALPAIDEDLRRQIRAIVVALKQAIALDGNLADAGVPERFA